MESSSKETRCDECEKWKKDIMICLECVETVCLECDTRIHNKGMRIHHPRVPYYPNLFEDKNNPKFKISYFSRQCYRNNFSNRRDFNEEIRKVFVIHFFPLNFRFLFFSKKQNRKKKKEMNGYKENSSVCSFFFF